MANFEETEEYEIFSSSDSNSDSEYGEGEDEDDELTLYETDEDSLNDNESLFSLDSELSTNIEIEELDTNIENKVFLDKIKDLIQNIILDKLTTIEEIHESGLLDEDDITIMNHFENQDNNFKKNILKVIFAKLILLQFNETIDISTITNISITLNPCNIEVIGLNTEDTEKINDFFMHYLETK